MGYDVIIVGAGPAGMSAAVYCARSNLKTLLLDKEAPGGKLLHLETIDNYLGFNNIQGSDLAVKMYEHLSKFDVELNIEKVARIAKENELFKVQTLDNIYESKTVIIASGLTSSRKKFEGEERLSGKGVSYCAVCDGALYKQKVVAYIGEGDVNRDIAYLANLCSQVIYFGNTKIFKYENVIQLPKPTSIEVLGEEVVNGIVCDNSFFEINGLFIESSMNSENVEISNLERDKNFIAVNSEMETSIPGLFSAGDVSKKSLRQVSTAISDGAIAATSAFKYIKNK